MTQTNRILITILGGWFGLHKYMDKKIRMGVLYTCTFGLFGIGWIMDIITACKNTSTSPDILMQTQSSSELQVENFGVAGISYYIGNINKLACTNPEWKNKNSTIVKNGHSGKRIYRYNYINKPVKLVEEPGNPHDENAIMVIIAGEHVGYIASSECLHVKDILHNHSIKYISSFIGGGEYKIVSDAQIMSKDEQGISINIRIAYS